MSQQSFTGFSSPVSDSIKVCCINAKKKNKFGKARKSTWHTIKKKQLLIYSYASYLCSDQTCSLPPRKWNGLFSSVSTFLSKKKIMPE